MDSIHKWAYVYGVTMVDNIKGYFAKKTNEKIQYSISDSDEMDKYLTNGFSIYQLDIENKETIIATPDKGYLIEKPIFPQEKTNRTR